VTDEHEHEHDDEGYDGQAVLAAGGADHPVRAVLGARFDPLVGRVVWYGRLEGAPADLSGGTEVRVRTPHGDGVARLTERDLWGHWHVRSETSPPFVVEILDAPTP
jgi:hypothetical protein